MKVSTMMGLYPFIENLCRLSTAYDEDIVSQWNGKALMIRPGSNPLEIYGKMRSK